MHRDDVWNLIEEARRTGADPNERLRVLCDRLSTLPLPEIVGFQVGLDEVRRPLDTWVAWAAAARIMGGFCSDDGFWYFQPWVIGLGRDAYERVVADPDALADLPEVRRLAGRPFESWSDAEWPQWEELAYAAAEAYEARTGREDGLEDALDALDIDLPAVPNPPGDSLTDTARARLLPKLHTLFP
ncbi:DUF4240 domain-containing protein [Embleya hyalina]|uniref:DUF4240 domain-containing protein n=1 Tax=Embleya hyalina TaxID=516124 RepID=UPI00135B192D|nr:DUF4240 domain-containing protein [Embleya hyalina]